MQLATWKNLQVVYKGRTKFGPLYVIAEGEKILHGGCIGYVRCRWRKITGESI